MIDLCNQAAGVIAGQPVKVYVRQPIIKGVRGVAYLDHNKRAIIEVRPGLLDHEFLYTLSHEAAHHAAGDAKAIVSDPRPGMFGRALMAARRKLEDCQTQETQADREAGRWVEFAEIHAGRYSGTWLERRLKAIRDYHEIKIDAMIDAAVNRAVLSVYKKYQIGG